MNLLHIGWSHPPQANIIRITHRHKGIYQAINPEGIVLTALLSGNFEFTVNQSSDYPCVGDFCISSPVFEGENNKPTVLIQRLCERSSHISRIAAGKTHDQQVLATNIDYAFIVCSVLNDFNVNRIQRYILLAQQGKVMPIIILSKVDLVENTDTYLNQLNSAHPTIPIISSSTMNNTGIVSIESYLTLGKTGVFIGSSGAGKSSLVNALLKHNVQKVHTVREDDQKGRHTTTGGSLFFIESRGMIIDTPGLREIAVFAEDAQVEDSFAEIKQLLKSCQFSNCSHNSEPGCAILNALENGQLDEAMLNNYFKLKREADFSKRKMDKNFASNQKKRWKRISQNYRKHEQFKNKQNT